MTDTIWTPDLPEGQSPKYRALTDAIRAAVHDGTLAPGGRMAPVRELAYRLGITPGTVARAYTNLTEEGVLTATVGRGTFVRDTAAAAQAAAEPPGARFLVEPAANALDLRGSGVPDVGQTQVIQRIMAEIAADQSVDFLRYPTRVNGAACLAAFLRWLDDTPLGPVATEDVVLTAGAQHGALVALQTLLRGPRHTVITEDLSYPGFRHAAGLSGATVVGIEMDGEGPLPDALEAACLKYGLAVYCTSSEVHNPTTLRTSERRRAEIVAVARAHDLHIIDDDCFNLGHGHAPGYRALAPERAWHVASVSKAITPAIRFGGVIAPEGWGLRAQQTAQYQFYGLSGPMVALVERLISSGAAEDLRRKVREVTARRIALAQDILNGFGATIRDDVPFVWLTMPRGWRASSFQRAAEAMGILVRPADLFALTDGRAPNAVRLSLSNAPMGDADLDLALRRLVDLLSSPPVEVEI